MLKKKYFEKFYLLSHLVRGRAILRGVLHRDFDETCGTFDYFICIIIIRIEINHLVSDSVECQLKASFTRVGEVLVA